jgi:hypothetical protein
MSAKYGMMKAKEIFHDCWSDCFHSVGVSFYQSSPDFMATSSKDGVDEVIIPFPRSLAGTGKPL